MKICTVGNCQARPLELLLKTMQPQIQSIGTIIVHLATADQMETNHALFEAADLIVAQHVQDNYPVLHVATGHLRAQFPEKLVVWPNLFFSGQTPSLVYVSKVRGGRVYGPLHEYQRRDFVEAYLADKPVAKAVSDARNGSGDAFMAAADQALKELYSRKEFTDVDICDIIEAEWQTRRMFHTFNHPTSWILIRLCERILKHIGLEPMLRLTPAVIGEMLDLIVPPMLPYEASSLGLTFDFTDVSRGLEVVIKEGKIVTGGRRFYSFEDLAEATYRALDAQSARTYELRYTPA